MVILKEIRLSKGLSQSQLSELTGISKRTIEDIERRKDCRVSTLSIIAKKLGISLDDLWSEEQGE